MFHFTFAKDLTWFLPPLLDERLNLIFWVRVASREGNPTSKSYERLTFLFFPFTLYPLAAQMHIENAEILISTRPRQWPFPSYGHVVSQYKLNLIRPDMKVQRMRVLVGGRKTISYLLSKQPSFLAEHCYSQR
jgi:hypothetical protein